MLILLYDLFYNARTYIASPTTENDIVIPSAKDCILIPFTKDYFMIPLFAESILHNVLSYKLYLRICLISFTYEFALYMLLKDLLHTCSLRI